MARDFSSAVILMKSSKGRRGNEMRPSNSMSYEAALDCYHSSEYEVAKALRLPPVAEGDLIIIEGYGGPQPE